jgi:hypothetical protein
MLNTEVKGFVLMVHLLQSCSTITNGLHGETFKGETSNTSNTPSIERGKKLTAPGLIGIVCVILIIIATVVCLVIKKCCWSNRQSTSLGISRTHMHGGGFSAEMELDEQDIHYYPVIFVREQFDNEIHPSPPRYSSVFDENGQEIVPVNT